MTTLIPVCCGMDTCVHNNGMGRCLCTEIEIGKGVFGAMCLDYEEVEQ